VKVLRVSAAAERDLDDIWHYVAVNSGSIDRANKFVDAIVQRLSVLAHSPKAGTVRAEIALGLRGLPVRDYNRLLSRNQTVGHHLTNHSWKPRSGRGVLNGQTMIAGKPMALTILRRIRRLWCLNIRCRVTLPIVFGGLAAALMAWDIHNTHVMESMGMAWDTGAPIWPYQSSFLILFAINFPAFVLAAPFFVLGQLQTYPMRIMMLPLIAL